MIKDINGRIRELTDRLQHLPANRIWKEGTAPVERYEVLESITFDTMELTVDALEAVDKGKVKTDTIVKLLNLVANLISEVNTSRALLNPALSTMVKIYIGVPLTGGSYNVRLTTASGKPLLEAKFKKDKSKNIFRKCKLRDILGLKNSKSGINNYPDKAIENAVKRLELVKKVLEKKYINPAVKTVQIKVADGYKYGLLGRILGLKKYRAENIPIRTYIITQFSEAIDNLSEVAELAKEVKDRGIYGSGSCTGTFNSLYWSYIGKVEVKEDIKPIILIN